MCELLGMSANVPTDICFSFSGLMQRGGKTGIHQDGWGIVFYDGKGCQAFHDPRPSADSKIAKLISNYPIKSKLVISHIRKANRGSVSVENTHPFSRVSWRQNWTFAHNGQLKGIKKIKLKRFFPVGTTDSEHAFCWLLDNIYRKFPDGPNDTRKYFKMIGELCRKLNSMGVANLLFSDSKYLYTFCSTKLCWLTRKAPFGKASLIDQDLKVNFKQVTTPNDIVTVIATQALTQNEIWTNMQENEFLVFKNGQIYHQELP